MMFHIVYKGKYRNEKQLIGNDKLPEKAIPFKEGNTLNDVYQSGFLLELPIIIPVILITLIRIQTIKGHIDLNLKTVCILLIALIVYYGLKLIHEYIHALLYPVKSEKTIWKYTSGGAYFIYCNAQVSKLRFIVISSAPMIILGLIPFIIWLFTANQIELTISLVYVFMTWFMILFAMGDLVNVYHTLKQVPKNAKVFNYGLHSYWIIEQRL